MDIDWGTVIVTIVITVPIVTYTAAHLTVRIFHKNLMKTLNDVETIQIGKQEMFLKQVIETVKVTVRELFKDKPY